MDNKDKRGDVSTLLEELYAEKEARAVIKKGLRPTL